jgi:adenylyltransferase/sulfurtransferase
MERYIRQTIIEKIGEEGQARLASSSVAVIGVGGLGSPILMYLAASGVGRITMIDYDAVELSNLNRQLLHSTEDIGRRKVVSADRKLVALNPEIAIHPLAVKLTKENARDLLAEHDLVIGALDSLETRFIVNEACVNLGIPYLDGGVKEFGGMVIFSNPPQTPCFNCVFPKKKKREETIGVIGVTAGIVGTIQADIALIHLLELPNPLHNKLLIFDGLRLSVNLVNVVADEKCGICGRVKEL